MIVDGGSENNNFRIRNFIRHCHVKINKSIALKEVHFSNSMIEGHFKILKQYLRGYGEIHNNPELVDIKPFLDKANQERLHANRTSCCKDIT